MTFITHLSADAEPLALHGQAAAANKHIFAVHLSCQVQDEDEDAARAATQEFLGGLATGTLHLVDVSGGAGATATVVPDAPVTAITPVTGAAPDSINNWLDRAKQGFAELAASKPTDALVAHAPSTQFFSRPPDMSSGIPNMQTASAFDLLRSTAKWPAPLAQHAGLMRAVKFEHDIGTDPGVTTGFVLVYVPSGQTLTANLTVVAVADDICEMTIETDDGTGTPAQSTQKTARLIHYDAVWMAARRLEDTGLYRITGNSEDLSRLLIRIEEQAPTLLWPATTLGTKALDRAFGAVLWGGDPKDFSDESKLPRDFLFWFIKASVASLFDIAIGGLLLPVHNSRVVEPSTGESTTSVQRQSMVLQRLSRRLVAYLEDLAEQAGEIPQIDEPRVFEKLLDALWQELARLNVDTLWNQIAPLVPKGSVPTIKDALPIEPNPDALISWKDWKTKLGTLSQELGDLALVLEGEEGAESWLLARFDEAFLDNGEFRQRLLEDTGVAIPQDAAPDATAEEIAAAKKARETFRTDLKRIYAEFVADISGPFDSAEAMRRDYGADVVSAVLAMAVDNSTPAAHYGELREALPEVEIFNRRFKDADADGENPFERLFGVCIDVPMPAALGNGLRDVSEKRMKELTADTPSTAVFRPDASPQPLRIPLMQSLDPAEADSIAERISGLGFLVQGFFPGDPRPAPDHVNLIEVTPATGKVAPFVTVEPTLPLPTPGTASLYLPYDGQPVSSPSRASPGNGGQQQSQAEKKALALIAGYVREEVTFDGAATGTKTTTIQAPELSYGAEYGVQGFWVPPSGVLPKGLGENHFTPRNPEDNSFDPTGYVRYQRRTAIAETTITGFLPKRPLSRDIHPLALDDPRLVVESLAGGHRHIDLYRAEDGSGALEVGDYILWVDPNTNDPEYKNPVKEHLILSDFDSGALGLDDLEVRLMTTQAEPPVGMDWQANRIAFSVDPGKSAWLRLSCGATAAEGTIVFDDPEHDNGQDSAARTAPLMVLAPEASDDLTWTEDQTRPIELHIPGVSFSDLERWASNIKLWMQTTGLPQDEAQDFLDWLRSAHALCEAIHSMGNEELGGKIRTIAEQLKQLPDPAVSGFVIGAGISDALKRSAIKESVRSLTRFESVSPYSGITFEEIDLGALALDTKAVIDQIQGTVDEIFEKAKVPLTVQGGSATEFSWNKDGLLVLPKGQIAQLWATPAVRESLFDQDSKDQTKGIFDARMLWLACGKFETLIEGEVTKFELFDGAKLVIEVMDTIEGTFEFDPIAARALGSERGYSVHAKLDENQRIYSEAELITQRWRPSGQPIYSYIDPAPFGILNGPVIRVDDGPVKSGLAEHMPVNHTPGDIAAFESEAFIGRQASDGERTRVRLNPAPDATELWAFDWPEHSATYLRHAAVFRSRYGAAMRQNPDSKKKPVKTTTTSDENGTFVLRIAILADVTGAAPTRPQLRTHLPIQRRLEPGSIAPPIACVLNEPPHAQLGLADRVSADLVFTDVFDFKHEGGHKLHLDQLRKEIGPDPLLSYFPVKNEQSRLCRIAVEGPVGLHFDGPQSATPAFANSQYMLHLTMDEKLGDTNLAELEESFAGISLTRHADPGWTWQQHAVDAATLSRDRDIWIEPGKAFKLLDGETEILKRECGKLNALRTALYQDGGAGFLEVVTDKDLHALLIKPIDDTRLRVTVFNKGETNPGDIKKNGKDNRPALLCSVILRTTGKITMQDVANSRALRQSDATFARWVRTARDMGKLAAGTGSDSTSVQVADLVAELGTDNRLTLRNEVSHVITSPVTQRRYPLHVHRRLVHLLLRPAPQVGAPVALFDQALLSDGSGAAIAFSPSKNERVRAETLVLAEMECRASILQIHTKGRLEFPHLLEYDSAKTDLLGSRLPDAEGGHVRLHIRAANAAISLKKLKMTATFVNIPRGPDKISVGGSVGFVDGDPQWSLDVVIYPDGKKVMARTRIPGAGFAEPQALIETEYSELTKAETLTLTMGSDAAEESWVDISLLQSGKAFNPDNPDAFDFDWLFADEVSALPDAISTSRLNVLPEAQARFVGITDPLRIQTK